MKSEHRLLCGFTLVELLLVLGIMALLAAFLFIGAKGSQDIAFYRQTEQTIVGIYNGLEIYKLENHIFPYPETETNVNAKGFMRTSVPVGQVGMLKNSEVKKAIKYNISDVKTFNEETDPEDCLCDGWGMPLVYLYRKKTSIPNSIDVFKNTHKVIFIYSYGKDKLGPGLLDGGTNGNWPTDPSPDIESDPSNRNADNVYVLDKK